jgi:hypothetical protein
MSVTDWRPEPTDAHFGDFHAWPWVEGMDDEVAIDVKAQLLPDEPVVFASTLLWRLKAYGEPENLDVTTTNCIDPPLVEGTVIKQRIAGLVAGRVYRLYAYHGIAGNHRASSLVIEVNPQ